MPSKFLNEKTADKLLEIAAQLENQVNDGNQEASSSLQTAANALIAAGIAKDKQGAWDYLKEHKLYSEDKYGAGYVSDAACRKLAGIIEARADLVDDGQANHSLADNRVRLRRAPTP